VAPSLKKVHSHVHHREGIIIGIAQIIVLKDWVVKEGGWACTGDRECRVDQFGEAREPL
jgi:hypothetical protein